MDNNNMEFENTIHQYKQHSQPLTVNDDFEGKVFAKIKKKKTQRKVAASVTLGLVIFSFIFIAQLVLVHKEPETRFAAQPRQVIKEEVPVMDDVVYASSDSRTTYAIEQVGYYEEEDTI